MGKYPAFEQLRNFGVYRTLPFTKDGEAFLW